MKQSPYVPSEKTKLDPLFNDGWSLLREPSKGRRGPVLARSTFMSQIDDGWVLPEELPKIRLVAAEDTRVNLNSATQLDLQGIPGIGQGKANRIIGWRQRNGGFARVEDLANVSGFGAKSVAKIADLLTV